MSYLRDQNIQAFRRMRQSVEYEGADERITGETDDALNPKAGARSGFLWVHSSDGRIVEQVLIGDRMIPFSGTVGVRCLVGNPTTGGARTAFRPIIDDLSAEALRQRQLAQTLSQMIPAANITGGRVLALDEESPGLNVWVEALPEVGWNGGEMPVDGGDLPSGDNEFAWVVVYFPPFSGTPVEPTYAVTTPVTRADISLVPTLDAFNLSLPPGAIRTQAFTVFTDETDITNANTRWLEMRRHITEGTLLSEAAETITIASGTATLGYGSNFVLAPESGTADTVTAFAVTGVPRLLVFKADSGDTITIDDGTAVDFNGGGSIVLYGEVGMVLFWDGAAVIDIGTGGALGSGTAGAKYRNVETRLHYTKLGGASASLSSGTIDTTDYDRVIIRLHRARSDLTTGGTDTNDTPLLAINGDTTNGNYLVVSQNGGSSTAGGLSDSQRYLGVIPASDSTANFVADGEWWIAEPGVAGNGNKNVVVATQLDPNTVSSSFIRWYSLLWKNTAAITSIDLTLLSGANFTVGTIFEVVGVKREPIGGLETSDANVSSPPTDAELDAEFGTPATVGDGFTALLDDNGADSAVYLVASNGTSWWYATLTKAL